jgi:hypothetical protein
MGTWGYGIFEDDAASDVRGEFEDDEEGAVIWLTLAAIQLEHGFVQDDIRDRALAAMTSDLERWKEAGPDEVAQRKIVLDELRGRIDGTGRART